MVRFGLVSFSTPATLTMLTMLTMLTTLTVRTTLTSTTKSAQFHSDAENDSKSKDFKAGLEGGG